MMNCTKSMIAALCLVAIAGCAPGSREMTPAAVQQTWDLLDLTDFVLLRTDSGARAPEPVTVAAAADVLATYDVIFIGEVHRHPGNHAAQMDLFREIHRRAPKASLSLEQFERDVQSTVDDYMAGKIGEEPFRKQARAWDNYPVSYRPLVEYAKEHGLPVIAAEAPTMVVRCVGQEGPEFLSRMKADQRGWAAAQLNLGDGPYKDKYMRFAAGDGSHGEDSGKSSAAPSGPSPAAMKSFAAQVTRDDTMAESIYLHLEKNPGRKVVHLNGNFHSESFLGTAERLQMRNPKLKIAVVNPIQVKTPEITADDAKTGTFVLAIRPAPKSYANMDEMRAAIREQMKFRNDNKCEL